MTATTVIVTASPFLIVEIAMLAISGGILAAFVIARGIWR